jgi:hypothetical protein
LAPIRKSRWNAFVIAKLAQSKKNPQGTEITEAVNETIRFDPMLR